MYSLIWKRLYYPYKLPRKNSRIRIPHSINGISLKRRMEFAECVPFLLFSFLPYVRFLSFGSLGTIPKGGRPPRQFGSLTKQNGDSWKEGLGKVSLHDTWTQRRIGKIQYRIDYSEFERHKILRRQKNIFLRSWGSRTISRSFFLYAKLKISEEWAVGDQLLWWNCYERNKIYILFLQRY